MIENVVDVVCSGRMALFYGNWWRGVSVHTRTSTTGTSSRSWEMVVVCRSRHTVQTLCKFSTMRMSLVLVSVSDTRWRQTRTSRFAEETCCLACFLAQVSSSSCSSSSSLRQQIMYKKVCSKCSRDSSNNQAENCSYSWPRHIDVRVFNTEQWTSHTKHSCTSFLSVCQGHESQGASWRGIEGAEPPC